MVPSRSGIQDKPAQEFNVALLMEEISEAKLVSDSLREMGIFAQFFSNLDELWMAVNAQTPDLCIIDVKMMSQGTLLFKNQPKVKNNSMKYAFYYSDETQFLLNSAFALNHYGLIRKEVNITGQLQSILRRRNDELKLENEVRVLGGRITRLKTHGQRMASQQEDNHNFKTKIEMASEMAGRFGSVSTEMEFYKRTISFFNDWEDCKQFGIYAISATGQKLMAPKSNATKYRRLPDLWLAKESMHGITDTSCDMAYEVCYGLMDESIKAIRIFGTKTNPDILVVGLFDEDELADFNWSIFENKLNSEYRKSIAISAQGQNSTGHDIDIFDAFQYMDDIQFHKAQTDHRLATIDLENLTSLVRQTHSNRFSWKAFAKEFRNELDDNLSGNYKISSYGAESFLIFIDKNFLEKDFTALKTLVNNFQFWRFFDDTAQIVGSEIIPEVKLVGPSSVNVMRQMGSEFKDNLNTDYAL